MAHRRRRAGKKIGLLAEIGARGRLEDTKVELGHDGQQVVEDVGLNLLVRCPISGAGKEVEFYGNAVVGGLEVAHQYRHLIIHRGQVVQIGIEVGAENAQVGLASAVDQYAIIDLLRFIVIFYNLLCLVDVVGQQFDFAVFVQHLRCAEAHAVHVDVDRALHPSAAALLHATSVLERVAHQQVGRNGGDGVVPVAHLHGVECHLYHGSVSTVLRHGNPVAHLQHVVGGELYA